MAIRKYDIDGKQFYEVHVKVRDNFGRQINRRRRGLPSEAKAKRLELELRMGLFKLKDGECAPLWEEWVEVCMRRIKVEFRASTVLNYKGNLGKRITPYLRGLPIDKIKPSHIHDVLFKHQIDISDETRKSLLKNIRRIFNLAVQEGYVSNNPTLGIKIKIAEKELKCLNKTEIDRLLSEAYFNDHPYYSVWSLAILTGMRSGELMALLWSDIDFDNKVISVNKSWSSKNGTGATKSFKNRFIPISKELERFLKEMKLESDSPNVLPRLKEWRRGNQAKVLRSFCKQLGITEIRFHDLRATFITQMLIRNEPLPKVMYIAGHARISTTQRYLRMLAREVSGSTEALGITLPSSRSSSNKVVSLV